MWHLFRYHRRSGLRFVRCRRKLEGHRPRSARSAFRGGANPAMIRVVLPAHLRTLAKVDGEVSLDLSGEVTQAAILTAIEQRYPMLAGTIRDHGTLKRRPFIRFFACGEDLSHESPDSPVPEQVVKGAEPFMVVGAIAGG